MASLGNAFQDPHCWVILVWSFLAVAKIQAESSTKALKLLTGVVSLQNMSDDSQKIDLSFSDFESFIIKKS